MNRSRPRVPSADDTASLLDALGSGPMNDPIAMNEVLLESGDKRMEEAFTRVSLQTHDALRQRGFPRLTPIGVGGFGVACLARHERSQQHRAIKIFVGKSGASAEEERVAEMAFKKERQIFELGVLPVGLAPHFQESGPWDTEHAAVQPFLVMEFISGESIGEWAARKPRPPITEREQLCRDLFNSYERLHGAGVLHGDLSKGNIMIQDGQVRLVDFGGASLIGNPQRSEYSLTTPLQTPGFSVRLTTAQKLQVRDDVHKLARIAFLVLTGRETGDDVDLRECRRLLDEEKIPRETARIVLDYLDLPNG